MMTVEFVGAEALQELFDIIARNYVSKEELENKEKSVASAISVSAALNAAAILKVAEAIMTVKGGEGGEEVDERLIATDSEVNEILDKYFGNSSTPNVEDTSDDDNTVDDENVATDEEVADTLNDYFN